MFYYAKNRPSYECVIYFSLSSHFIYFAVVNKQQFKSNSNNVSLLYYYIMLILMSNKI